ncbi:MAG TPA: pyridoxamine 5'-phosphate oxidase family protein [Ilumatobacteraceae bacterium]|nr:pyridoxamine 5'-phosphate oxidase family protein [Ilumatobacteraceae bacterium]
MSQTVELADLATAMADHAFAYLLTQPELGAPHAVAVIPAIDGDALVVNGLGRRTVANAAARPEVSLVWPPKEPGDYSLIVDGTARITDDRLIEITPTRAVRHRPAPGLSPGPSACMADCIEIPLPS